MLVNFIVEFGGEDAECRFCEHKRLNMSTLRMTWEAKVQLKEILINSGFAEGKLSVSNALWILGKSSALYWE
jgi:hypothetical protein